MADKKKKVSPQTAKQLEAQQKNYFFSKVLQVAKAITGNDSYKLLTPNILDTIYWARFRSIKVVADDDLTIPAEKLQDLKDSILYAFREQSMQLETGYTLEVNDLLGPVLSLWFYLRAKKNHTNFLKLTDAFKDFIETEEIFSEAFNLINTYSMIASWDLTSFDKKIVSVKTNVKTYKGDIFCPHTEVRVTSAPPEIINLTIDGYNRPVFRVGLAYYGGKPIWTDLKAEILELKYFSPDTKIPVYIQHHAMNRLNERLDCIGKSLITISLIESLEQAKCIQYKDKMLVEFKLYDTKAGYLMIELIEGVVVIRTFLLLTHRATPEGDKLHEMLGLEKPDISYLNLDKLSTFVHSGLREKTQLCHLLSKAGCKPLMEIKKENCIKECLVANTSMIETYFSKYQEHKKQIQLD